ncbi:MAG: hypothetical protein U0Q15_11720 [Kineosporiaceae bacterium]
MSLTTALGSVLGAAVEGPDRPALLAAIFEHPELPEDDVPPPPAHCLTNLPAPRRARPEELA